MAISFFTIMTAVGLFMLALAAVLVIAALSISKSRK